MDDYRLKYEEINHPYLPSVKQFQDKTYRNDVEKISLGTRDLTTLQQVFYSLNIIIKIVYFS